MNEIWNAQTNEDLCKEYQQTMSNELYEYFLSRNMGLMMDYLGPIIAKHPEQKEELIQQGRVAMWEAMRRFKPDNDTKFSTYCYFYFKKNVWHHWHEQFIVTVPINLMNKMNEVKEKVPYAAVDTISTETSFSNNEGDTDMTLGDTLASEEPDPLAVLMEKDSLEYLMKLAKQCLSPRQLNCLVLYYGLDGHEPRTLQEVGDMFHVTRERIRQILEKALHKLRVFYKRQGVRDEDKD